MKTILPLAAAVALAGAASAQQNLIPLPSSADLALQANAPAPVGVSPMARATTACDDFNRSTLGPDWIPLNGAPGIISDAYAATASGNTHMQHATASVNYDSAVIFFELDDNPQTLIYGAGSFGLGGGDNLYVKIQRNGFGPGLYDTVGFYTGNGSNTSGTTGWGGFFGLTTPIAGGYVTMYVDPNSGGDVLLVDLDEDRDGVPEQTLVAPGSILSGFPAGTFGTGIGLGCYGDGLSRCVDNFELNGGCGPVGPQLAATGTAGGTMTFDFSGYAGGEQIAIVYGPAGTLTGNAPCGSVTVDLLPLNFPPPSGLIFLTADANGDAQLVQGVPGGAVGLLVQGVGLTGCLTTNTVTIQ